MGFTAMAFLWTGSQIPVYLFGTSKTTTESYRDILLRLMHTFLRARSGHFLVTMLCSVNVFFNIVHISVEFELHPILFVLGPETIPPLLAIVLP
jgi:hypothetical protein